MASDSAGRPETLPAPAPTPFPDPTGGGPAGLAETQGAGPASFLDRTSATEPFAGDDPTRTGPGPGSGSGSSGGRNRDQTRPPRFLGEYEIVEEIARGGMGVVYRAWQVKLNNRPVALKVIRDIRLAGPSDLRRFRAEAEAIAALDHPNIVPIYEVGQDDDQPYFSMKLIEGGNLTKHIERLMADPRAAALLMEKVARAVHYAHQRTILHRDLKPSNILVDNRGEPYVTDFGLAMRLDPMPGDPNGRTQTGTVMGTPAYMPPEQALGKTKTLTTAADVYSLGATLYETLSGKPPFVAESVPEILRMVVEQEPARIRPINPKVDRDLETICLKCLEKAPAKRYGSAENLAEDLERWRLGQPIKARSVSTRERIVKWVRRKPTIAALIGISAVALISLVVGGVYFTRNLERLLDLANRDRYSSDMNLARRAWDDKEVYRVREYLDKYRDPKTGLEGYRSFEWYYLWKLCDPRLVTLSGHAGNVLAAVAYSHDGLRLATSGSDSTIRIWDPERKRVEHVLQGHTGSVGSLAFHPDGRLLASGSTDGTVRLWNLATRDCRTLKVGNEAHSLEFSPDGRTLAVTTDVEDRVALWDVESGELNFNLDTFEKGQQLPTFTNWNTVRFSPDGSRIYVTDNSASGVAVWDVPAKRLVKRLNHGMLVHTLSLTGDGRWLVTLGSQQSISIWNTATLTREYFRPIGGARGVTNSQIMCSFQGHVVAFSTISMGRSEIFDLDTRRRIENYETGVGEFGHQGLALRSDGRRLAVSRGKEVVIATVVTQEPMQDLVSEPGAGIGALSVRGDGARLAWAAIDDPRVVVWDPQRRERVRTLAAHEIGVLALAYGPPSMPDLLASAGADGKVCLWDSNHDGPALHTLEGHVGEVLDVAFLPDGRTLVSAGADGKARVWDTETGRTTRILDGQAGPLQALAVSPDRNRVAAAGGNGSILIWEVDTGRRVLKSLSLDVAADDVAFSADGKWLAAGGSTPGSGGLVAVWNAASGSLLSRWVTPNAIRSLVFSSDGQRVITAGTEGPLVVWDAITGRETISLEGHRKPVLALVTSPGLRIYSAGLDGTVKLWEGLDPGPALPPPRPRDDGKVIRIRPLR